MRQRTSQASRARRDQFRGLPVRGFTESELDSGRTSGNLAANNMSARLLPSSLSRRYAWVPIPVLLTLIVGLRLADLPTVYESRWLMVLLNLAGTCLAAICICILTARGFLANGQPGLLLFSCGSVIWGSTSLIAAAMDKACTHGVAFVLDISDRKASELQARTHLAELRQMNAELSRFNRAAVDRELRMIELKKEVNSLCAAAGQPDRYPLPPV